MDLLLLLLRLLLAAALYLFLGVMLLLLWRGLRRTDEAVQTAPRRYGRLVVVAVDPIGEETEEICQVGAAFPLRPVTSLGRAAFNSITIPDAYASSEHALLTYRGGQWWLQDRGSRNGTTLNAVTVEGPTVVSAGDVVGVGRVQLKVELADLGIGTGLVEP